MASSGWARYQSESAPKSSSPGQVIQSPSSPTSTLEKNSGSANWEKIPPLAITSLNGITDTLPSAQRISTERSCSGFTFLMVGSIQPSPLSFHHGESASGGQSVIERRINSA